MNCFSLFYSSASFADAHKIPEKSIIKSGKTTEKSHQQNIIGRIVYGLGGFITEATALKNNNFSIA